MTVIARCPVCGGNGLRPEGFYTTTTGTWFSTGTSTEPCRSCDGRGIIEPQLAGAVDALREAHTALQAMTGPDFDPTPVVVLDGILRDALLRFRGQ